MHPIVRTDHNGKAHVWNKKKYKLIKDKNDIGQKIWPVSVGAEVVVFEYKNPYTSRVDWEIHFSSDPVATCVKDREILEKYFEKLK